MFKTIVNAFKVKEIRKRLKELTRNNAKCMVEVNGVSLVERALRILDKKNLTKIVIVVGYEAAHLMQFIDNLHIQTPIVFINNEIYDKTNNILYKRIDTALTYLMYLEYECPYLYNIIPFHYHLCFKLTQSSCMNFMLVLHRV